jgi:DNA (cytosine-5)-methyltransferase 1
VIVHALRADGFDASEDGTGRGTPLTVAFARNQRDEVREMEVAGALAGEPGMKQQTYIAFSAKDHGADAGPLSPTLRAGGHSKSHANAGVMPAIAFDTTQITSKANYSVPKSGDPCHPISAHAHAHAPAIAFDARQSDVIQYGYKTGPLDTDGSSIGIGIGSAVRRLTPKECARLQGFPDTYLDITYRGKPAADGPKYKALGNSMAVPVMAWIGKRIQMVSEL